MNSGNEDGYLRSTYSDSIYDIASMKANNIRDIVSRDSSKSVLDSYFTGGNLASTRKFTNVL